ncbi:MAG: hypothetical protein HZC29_05980 [Thaumarchaeota archaeon]|nr:hypothetical protein [Nitrososphaerota archaeon]
MPILQDWRILSIGFTLIAVILIAIAYMFGHAFDIIELKSWGAIELNQSIVTVIIIISFAGVITILDGLLQQIVVDSNLGFNCNGTNNCAVTTAVKYFDGLIDLGEDQIKDNLQSIVRMSQTGTQRFGIFATELILPPLLQATLSGTTGAGYIIDSERLSATNEHIGNLLGLFYAQKFFVKEFSYYVAPLLLVLGLVCRSFFVTRRLGGLLISIAIGIMYVFPLMFVVNWITLNIALFGDKIISPPMSACPASCLYSPPTFYVTENGHSRPLYTKGDVVNYLGYTPDVQLSLQLEGQIDQLASGAQSDIQLLKAGGGTVDIVSCEFAARSTGTLCPTECRDLPYSTSVTCKGVQNGKVNAPVIETACNKIHLVCKVIRYVNPSDPYFRTPTADPIYDEYKKMDRSCPVSCRTIPPLKEDCYTASPGCVSQKDYLRYAYADQPGPSTCPAAPNAYDSCSYVLPSKQKLARMECDGCLFVPQQYTYNPPIYASCSDLCNPNPLGPPKISPGEFAKATQKNMFGRSEVKTAASLILPGYILPILNIVVTVMFIRTFSSILGGDMEIPGLSKIL